MLYYGYITAYYLIKIKMEKSYITLGPCPFYHSNCCVAIKNRLCPFSVFKCLHNRFKGDIFGQVAVKLSESVYTFPKMESSSPLRVPYYYMRSFAKIAPYAPS